jgi:hypothetical protein
MMFDFSFNLSILFKPLGSFMVQRLLLTAFAVPSVFAAWQLPFVFVFELGLQIYLTGRSSILYLLQTGESLL